MIFGSDGDDIILYADDARTSELMRFNMLRQQEALPSGQPNRSLADFVAPSGQPDWVGGFVVTDRMLQMFKRKPGAEERRK